MSVVSIIKRTAFAFSLGGGTWQPPSVRPHCQHHQPLSCSGAHSAHGQGNLNTRRATPRHRQPTSRLSWRLSAWLTAGQRGQCGHAARRGSSRHGQDGAGRHKVFTSLLRTAHAVKLRNCSIPEVSICYDRASVDPGSLKP